MKTKEKGQIIVVLAVALVAILGITALAVDGSMIYAERRNDQTTADSTALSAAQTASGSPTCATARTAAINQAITYASAQEGVALVNDSTSPNRVEATCNADNTKLTIKVVVTSGTPTTFAQMVSRDQLQTTVESLSQVTFGSTTFANGNGLWATGTTCDANGGIWLSGTSKVFIKGGGAYSASCISERAATGGIFAESGTIIYSGKTGNGMRTLTVGSKTEYIGTPGTTGTNGIIFSNNTRAFLLANTADVPPDTSSPNYKYQLSDGMIQSGLSANPLFSEAQWPTYQSTIPTLSTIPVMPTQPCTGLVDYGTPDLSYSATPRTLNPGIYTKMDQGYTNLVLNPGVYCIKAGGSLNFNQLNVTANNTIIYFMGAGSFNVGSGINTMTMNSSSIYLTNGNFDVSNGTFNANPITIYIKQGNFYLRNGAYGATMKAPTCSDSSCGVGPAIKGVLVYMDPANTGTFNILNGNS
ncbi:hypothetical protein EG832_11025, partial [bacterium]|nr:hypothetical protein [bacterium]